MKHSLMTFTALSGLTLALIGTAAAQEPPSRQDGAMASAPVTQFAQNRDMRAAPPRLQKPLIPNNVKLKFRQLSCEKGETKKLIMKGQHDSFAASGNEPAARSARFAANGAYSQYPFTNRYDDTRTNVHFGDHLLVPSATTSGFIAFGARSNGSSLDTNDVVSIGDLSGNQTPGQRRAFGAVLPSLGAPFTRNVADFYAPLNSVHYQASGQTLLSDIQAGSGTTTVDFHVQDDHSVDYLAIGVCVAPKVITDAVLETAGCAGKEVKIDTKYGPGAIREYCYGDPIIFSTAGTTPADNFHVGLETFDPDDWSMVNQIHPGAWTCNNGTCPPPAHLMPASYNSPAGAPLPPNAPGEVYRFSFAVGPTWDSETIMFRIVNCPKKGVTEDVEMTPTPRGEIEPRRLQKR